MAAAVGTAGDLRALLRDEEALNWRKSQRLNALISMQEGTKNSFLTCMAKERELTNRLLLAETTWRLTRTALEDHVPETMQTMRAHIDAVLLDAETYSNAIVGNATDAYTKDKIKDYFEELRDANRCCEPLGVDDAMISEWIQANGSAYPPYVEPPDEDEVQKRYAFLMKENPRMNERIATLKNHLAAYDVWCRRFRGFRIAKVSVSYARMRLSIDRLDEQIYQGLPNDQAIKQNVKNLIDAARAMAEEQVDGIKKQRAEEKERHNEEHFDVRPPAGAVTWLDHWNAVGKRSSATPLVRKDYVIAYSRDVEVGAGDSDDDDSDYYPSDDDEDGDREERQEPQQPQQPPAPLEELPDLGRQDPRRRPPREPPVPGNPGDAAWAAGRRAGQRGPPGRGRGGPSSSPTVDAAILAARAAREKKERKEKMEDAMKAIKQHLEDQIAKAKQQIEDSIDQNGQPTRTVTIETNDERGALMVDMERIFGEWAAYLGLSETLPDDVAELGALIPAFYKMVSTLFQEFYEEMEQMYPGGNVVGSDSTEEMLERRGDPETRNKFIYFWVADMSNYQVKLGETLEGVARFGDRFVYTALDLGIIMSPVSGLPEVVELSSDDEPDPALQGLPQPGAAGPSQPPSAGAQGFLDAQEQRKRQKLEEEKKAQEEAEAAAAALAAERAAAAAAQDAAQPEPGAAAFDGGGAAGAEEFELDEYGAPPSGGS